uniref:RING-type domain-containing protein n=1 Tax=Meleagris gallopavo TaxID=9103 RepID=G1NAU6_MELGA
GAWVCEGPLGAGAGSKQLRLILSGCARTCPVCFEKLDATAKVLPCQHTFCKPCLQRILKSQKELRCPECRTLVLCGIEQLPANLLLIRLLDGLSSLTPFTFLYRCSGCSGTAVGVAQWQLPAGGSQNVPSGLSRLGAAHSRVALPWSNPEPTASATRQ